MHLVLKAERATGPWCFRSPQNYAKVIGILKKFSLRQNVTILSFANVYNHMHFHIRFPDRTRYKRFIRAITSAIVHAISGVHRRNKPKTKFWDFRPFTRIIYDELARRIIENYIRINQFQGAGFGRKVARLLAANPEKIVELSGYG